MKQNPVSHKIPMACQEELSEVPDSCCESDACSDIAVLLELDLPDDGNKNSTEDQLSEISFSSDIDLPELAADEDIENENVLLDMDDNEDEGLNDSIDGDLLLDAQKLKDYKPTWTSDFSDFTVLPFTKYEGARLPRDFDTSTATACDYFRLFFDDEVIDKIVQYTNGYAEYKFSNPDYKDKNWTRPVTASDIRGFLGVAVIMGINPLHSYRDYWSKDPFVGNLGIQSVISLKQYETLNKYFHVSDRAAEPTRDSEAYDKIYKSS